jgi:hypothetical protein
MAGLIWALSYSSAAVPEQRHHAANTTASLAAAACPSPAKIQVIDL